MNNIDTSGFVLKTKYGAEKTDLEYEIPVTSELAKKTDYNTKITEIENKIASISGLITNSALPVVEDKIPNVSNLVKKTEYETKITEIEKNLTDHIYDKYITSPEFNNLAARVFTARLTPANWITKTDFDNKLKSLNQNSNSNRTKYLLVENELKKLQTFDSIYFRGKSHFEEDGAQNYLVLQPMYRYFKRIGGVGTVSYISFWKSNEFSDENIIATTTSDYVLNPQLSYLSNKTRVEFKKSCLKQDKITYTHVKIVNIYIVYEISEN